MRTQDSQQAQKRAPRGEGSCYEERRNGKVVGWVATLPIPGERPLTFRAQTQKEALAKRKDHEERVARGEVALVAGRQKREAAERSVIAPIVTITVEDHIKYWLEYRVKPQYDGRAVSDDPEARRESGATLVTYAHYSWEMDKHVLPYIGSTRFDALDEDVVEYLWTTLKRKGIAYGMRYKVLRDLRTCVNYTLKFRSKSTSLRWNPVASKLAQLEKPKSPEKPPVDYDVLSHIMDAARGLDKLELVVQIGLRTGLRRGNLCGLQFGDFAGGCLVVQRRTNRVRRYGDVGGVVTTGGLKGKRDDAVSVKQIDPAIFEPLLAEQRKRNIEVYLRSRKTWRGADPRSDEAYLFPTRYGTPTDPQEIYRKFKELVASVGAPEYTMHQMRHDFVNQARDSGADLLHISKMVDHASTKITEEVYTHLAAEHLNPHFLGVSAQLDARTRTAEETAV